jgi:predicted CXXCH cytochrome family protein
MPPGPSRLGTDLSDDHPISFLYDTRLALAKRELKPPSMLPPEVQLDKGGELQCTACHDPHDDTFGNFLVMSNQYSNLCVSCHDKNGWAISSHAVSHGLWNGLGANPWPNTDYRTVAENGCENCHSPHTAGGDERLLKFIFEEDNCLVCHNGNAAAKNVEREVTKPYRHSVEDRSGAHDAAEDFVSGGIPKHVECEDCHNPHQANDDASPGGSVVPGANKGVRAIGAGGQPVSSAQYIYEICFKCHADVNMVTTLPITRQIDQLNTRMEFNLANPSFHPVVSQGINPDVPSLLSPLTTQSIISCIDCHNTDNLNAPRGPHGSIYEYLLERDYNTKDFTQENPRNYAMCYKCHNRDSILRDQSFSKHRQHIVDQRAPCSACHDPHGISDIQGNPVNNSHLMNFDLTIVQANGQGRLEFDSLGTFTGQCFLNCHGEEHSPKIYP